MALIVLVNKLENHINIVYVLCYKFPFLTIALTFTELAREFLLPYQLGPLPPLDPQICVSAYKLKKKLMESSASTSTASNSSESATANGDPVANDEDSKASGTTDANSIDIQSELLKIIEEQKPSRRKVRRRRPVAGRNPRKSPRQHASTLAILSSLVHHRKKRGDLNRSRGSDLSTSRHSLPAIPEEEKEDAVDYSAIENDLEKMLTRYDMNFLNCFLKYSTLNFMTKKQYKNNCFKILQ